MRKRRVLQVVVPFIMLIAVVAVPSAQVDPIIRTAVRLK